MEVRRLTKDEWANFSEDAHQVVFDEYRPKGFDRLDYVLLLVEEDRVVSYVTIKEMDHFSCYWQFGGVMPDFRGQHKSYDVVKAFETYCREHYLRAGFLVQNTNKNMLVLAVKSGFSPIGMRTFKGDIFLEFTKEFEDAV